MTLSPRIAMILCTLEQGFDRKAWHGTTLRGSLRGVTAEEAAWRPAPDRHNIWELAVHAAYWKYVIVRRIRGGERGSFPLAGSNWFARPEEDTSEEAWKKDLDLLGRTHRELLEVVESLPDDRLDHTPEGTKFPLSELLTGGAFHDIYHAGQIQLLKRLQNGK
jgi:hypothetical protein